MNLKTIAYIVGAISPLTCVPQIIQIINTKSSADVSILCWGLSAIASIFWIYYAWKIKNKEFMVSAIGWTAMQITTIMVTLTYW